MNIRLHEEQMKKIVESIYYEYFQEDDDDVNVEIIDTSVVIHRKNKTNIDFDLEAYQMQTFNMFVKNVHKQLIRCRRNLEKN